MFGPDCIFNFLHVFPCCSARSGFSSESQFWRTDSIYFRRGWSVVATGWLCNLSSEATLQHRTLLRNPPLAPGFAAHSVASSKTTARRVLKLDVLESEGGIAFLNLIY